MKDFSPLDIERMVSLKGMIIRCSSIIPEIREAIFRCLVCGYCTDPVAVERGNSMGHLCLFILLVISVIFCICNNLLIVVLFRTNN